jgi:hypothetical protein
MSSVELFNVRLNGVDVAIGISRAAAQVYLDQRRVTGGFCQVYLTSRPLEGRHCPYHYPVLLRRLRSGLSIKKRAEIMAQGTVTEEQ